MRCVKHALERVRDDYLACFAASVAKAHERFDQFTTELLLELPSLKHAERLYRLYRADIIGKRGGKDGILEVNAPAKKVVRWRGFFPPTLRIDAPLIWNGIEFRVVGGRPQESALLEWVARWLDPSDDRYDDAAPFQGVIHNATPPKPVEPGYLLSVDFGSAPTKAFDELASVLLCGASLVSVGSFSFARASPGEV